MLNNNKKQETQFFGTKCGNANSIAAGYATETTNYGEIATGILNKSTRLFGRQQSSKHFLL